MRAREKRVTRQTLRTLIAFGGLAALVMTFIPEAVASDKPPVEARAFANGQTAHVSLLETGDAPPPPAPTRTRLVNADVSWAAASADADGNGLSTALRNEFNRIFSPALPNEHTYARASAVELGLGTTPNDANDLILMDPPQDPAEAKAPGGPPAEDKSLVNLDLDPLLYLGLLRGKANANWNTTPGVGGLCILDDDISRGKSYLADLELLDADGPANPMGNPPEGLEQALLALNSDENPEHAAVSDTKAVTRLVPTAQPGVFGLESEVRQTIAPVTLFDTATPLPGPLESLRGLTIKVLGEWVLRVRAMPDGSTSVWYGPDFKAAYPPAPGQPATPENPDSPIIQFLANNSDVLGELSFQDLFGNDGLDLSDAPPDGLGLPPNVLEIVVGEDPRAIADSDDVPPASDETSPFQGPGNVSAAVDVLRIKVLNQLAGPGEVADIRLGHMEAAAQVPSGGIICQPPTTTIDLNPDFAINQLPDDDEHTVDATVTENGAPKANVPVTFEVTSGPNQGATGTCNPANCQTTANGVVTWTYQSNGTPGTDTIRACITGTTICSTAQKQWNGPGEEDPPIFLLADEEAVDNGDPPNNFTGPDVNDDLKALARRTELRYFDQHPNHTIDLYTGQVGDEGFFALKEFPDTWNTAGHHDGLRNFIGHPGLAYPHHVGNGLGTGSDPEKYLDKINRVTPLRAEGLKALIGRRICAVVWDSDISMNYGPLNGSLKGSNLGTIAFKLNSVTPRSGSDLPSINITILNAATSDPPSENGGVCDEEQELFTAAPEPTSSSEPMDTTSSRQPYESQEPMWGAGLVLVGLLGLTRGPITRRLRRRMTV